MKLLLLFFVSDIEIYPCVMFLFYYYFGCLCVVLKNEPGALYMLLQSAAPSPQRVHFYKIYIQVTVVIHIDVNIESYNIELYKLKKK